MTAAASMVPAIVARVRPEIQRIGWSKFARLCGVDRSQLYKDFGPKACRLPSISTLERVLAPLGMQLTVAWAPTQGARG